MHHVLLFTVYSRVVQALGMAELILIDSLVTVVFKMMALPLEH